MGEPYPSLAPTLEPEAAALLRQGEARPLTWRDVLAIPETNRRVELIGGELCPHRSETLTHQTVLMDLWMEVRAHLEATGFGEAYCLPMDIRLSLHDQVQPDLVVLRRERVHLYRPDGTMEAAPDLVGEIVSEVTRTNDLVRKRVLYARAGIPEFWQFDPDARTAAILALEAGLYVPISPNADGTIPSRILLGFALDPEVVFAGLDRFGA